MGSPVSFNPVSSQNYSPLYQPIPNRQLQVRTEATPSAEQEARIAPKQDSGSSAGAVAALLAIGGGAVISLLGAPEFGIPIALIGIAGLTSGCGNATRVQPIAPGSSADVPILPGATGLGYQPFDVTCGTDTVGQLYCTEVPWQASFTIAVNGLDTTKDLQLCISTKNVNAAEPLAVELNPPYDMNSCQVLNAGGALLKNNDGSPYYDAISETQITAYASINPPEYDVDGNPIPGTGPADGCRDAIVWSGSSTYNISCPLTISDGNKGDPRFPIDIQQSGAQFMTNGLSWAGLVDPNTCRYGLADIQNYLRGQDGAQYTRWNRTGNGVSFFTGINRPNSLTITMSGASETPVLTGNPYYFPVNDAVVHDADGLGETCYSIRASDWKGDSHNSYGSLEATFNLNGYMDVSGIQSQESAGQYIYYLDVHVRNQQ